MKHRPHPLCIRPHSRSFALLGAAAFGLALLGGCANPNFIGVQDYGTIYGNVVDASGKPIVGALVSVTGSSGNGFRTNGDGSFRIPQVTVGTQTLSVSAPGFGPPAAPVTVLVVKNMEASVGNITLPSETSIPQR